MNKKIPKIKDQIDVLMTEETNLTHEELTNKISDLFEQNSHKAYDSFHISFVNNEQIGWALLFEGERKENKDETILRERMEATTRKNVEDAELKEYLRLHKKYGKKNK